MCHIFSDAAPKHGGAIDFGGECGLVARIVKTFDDVHRTLEVEDLGWVGLERRLHLGLGCAHRQLNVVSCGCTCGRLSAALEANYCPVRRFDVGFDALVLEEGGPAKVDVVILELSHMQHVIQWSNEGPELAEARPRAVHRIPRVVDQDSEIRHDKRTAEHLCDSHGVAQLAQLVVDELEVHQSSVLVVVLQVTTLAVALHRGRVAHPGGELEGCHGEHAARGIVVARFVEEPQMRVAEAFPLAVEALVHLIGGMHRDGLHASALGQALHKVDVPAREHVHGQEADGDSAIVAVGQLGVSIHGLAVGVLAHELDKEGLHGLAHVRIGHVCPVVHHAHCVLCRADEHDSHVEIRAPLAIDLVRVLEAIHHGEGLLADEQIRGDEHTCLGVLNEKRNRVAHKGHVRVREEHVEAELDHALDEADLVAVGGVPGGSTAHAPQKHRGDALCVRESLGLRIHGTDEEVANAVRLEGLGPVARPYHVLLI
mmetsp:Transcript_24021/g.64993  ORF Transcript_24021/g.64993 Transcript_24021/m.64993 type:complete len:484 (+) Transcript_24021:472-1923(+)